MIPKLDYFLSNKIDYGFMDSLIYLDKDFVLGKFEVVTGRSPETTVSTTSAVKAGIGLPGLSASGNISGTTAEKKSVYGMLDSTWKSLLEYGSYFRDEFEKGQSSKTGWITAHLGFTSIKYSENEFKKNFFILSCENGVTFLLNHREDSFYYQIGSLLEDHDKFIEFTEIKVRALIKVLPVSSFFERQLVAPLVMFEI